jgi:hypothetical protein
VRDAVKQAFADLAPWAWVDPDHTVAFIADAVLAALAQPSEAGGLEALRALSEKATPGEWTTSGGDLCSEEESLISGDGYFFETEDAEFIVAAVNYVRAALSSAKPGTVGGEVDASPIINAAEEYLRNALSPGTDDFAARAVPVQEHGPAQGLGEALKQSLAEMACTASVPMDLWDRHSNLVLKAADAGLAVTEALETCERVLRFDLRRLTTFGPDFNQAAKDALVKAQAVLALLANPATPEPSSMGRLGRNETSSAGEGEKLREALKPFAELVILADEEAERGDEDPLPERGSVHLLIEGEGELGNLPLSAFRRAADAYAAALASPDAVVPGGEGER